MARSLNGHGNEGCRFPRRAGPWATACDIASYDNILYEKNGVSQFGRPLVLGSFRRYDALQYDMRAREEVDARV